jgi:hypothetical protein
MSKILGLASLFATHSIPQTTLAAYIMWFSIDLPNLSPPSLNASFHESRWNERGIEPTRTRSPKIRPHRYTGAVLASVHSTRPRCTVYTIVSEVHRQGEGQLPASMAY